jgi:hypothetical protein
MGAGAVLALTGCGFFEPHGSYRVRMTVQAATSAGVRSGSSVLEITASKISKLLPEERSGAAGLKGEAVMVDLPDGPLFALLKNDDAGQPLDVRITQALSSGATFDGIDDYVAAVRALGSGEHRAELPRADWPLMVRFKDLNDPKSVEKVDPAAVGVKRILLETTWNDVSTGIEKRLRWLKDGGETLDSDAGPTLTPTFSQTLRQRELSTEIEQ